MSDKIEYSRLLVKRSDDSGVVPTIPSGLTLNTMSDTDTFVGEFFLNTLDDRLWIRTDNGQFEIMMSGNTSGNTQNLAQTLVYGNETFGSNIVVSSGDTIQYSGLSSGMTSTILGLDAFGNTITTTVTAVLTPNLSEVLIDGNTTGGNDIIMSQDDRIYSFTGDTYIEFNKINDPLIKLYSSNLVNGSSDVGVSPLDLTISHSDTGTTIGQMIIDNNSLDLSFTDGVNSTELSFTPTQMIITSNSGITYNSDYSSNYTNRTLVDKEYVVNSILGYTPTLNQVLTSGNTTGGKDIILSSGDTIQLGGDNLIQTTISGGKYTSWFRSSGGTSDYDNIVKLEDDGDGITISSLQQSTTQNSFIQTKPQSVEMKSIDPTGDITYKIKTEANNAININADDVSISKTTDITIDPNSYYLQVGDMAYSSTAYTSTYHTGTVLQLYSQVGNYSTTFILDPNYEVDVSKWRNEDNLGVYSQISVNHLVGTTLEASDGGSNTSIFQVENNQVITTSPKHRQGTANAGKYTFYNSLQTTGNTQTNINLIDLTGFYGSDRSIMVKVYVNGVKTDGTSGITSEFHTSYIYETTAPTLTQISTQDETTKSTFATANVVSTTQDGDKIKVQVQGEVGTTIYWTSMVEIIG